MSIIKELKIGSLPPVTHFGEKQSFTLLLGTKLLKSGQLEISIFLQCHQLIFDQKCCAFRMCHLQCVDAIQYRLAIFTTTTIQEVAAAISGFRFAHLANIICTNIKTNVENYFLMRMSGSYLPCDSKRTSSYVLTSFKRKCSV